MVDTVGLANSAPTPTTLTYNGRQARQLNGVAFAGATASRPLGTLTGVRPGTPTNTVSATSTVWTCGPMAGLADLMTAVESGGYPWSCDGVATGSMTPANASFPRQDIIVVTITDPENGSTTPTATRQYVAGTVNTAGTLTAVIPAQSFVVAIINVPKVGNGSPSTTWVAPYVVAAGGIQPVPASTYPANPFVGQYVDDAVLGLVRWNGAVWVAGSTLVQIFADQPTSVLASGATVIFGSLAKNATLSSPSADLFFTPVAGSGIKVLKAGVYSAAMGVQLANPVGSSRAFMQIDGLATPAYRTKRSPIGSTEDTAYFSTGPTAHAANDVISFAAFQATGSSFNMVGSTVSVTYHGPVA